MLDIFIFSGVPCSKQCVEMVFTREKRRFVCWSMLEQTQRLCSTHLWESFLKSHQQQSKFGAGKKFEDEGCLCRAKGSGRPAAAEKVERVRQTLLRSPQKVWRPWFLQRVWRVLRKRLSMKPYKLQLVQAITADNKQKRNNSVLICKRNLKKISMNVLCSVMRPHFIRMAKSIGIMFAFGAKRIPMPLLSMRGTHQKWMSFVPFPRIMFMAHFSLKEKLLAMFICRCFRTS